MRIFETRTVTESELFSLLNCPHTTTFTLLSIFSPLETSSMKRDIREFKVAEHSFQVPMPNSPLLLNHLCFGAHFLQE